MARSPLSSPFSHASGIMNTPKSEQPNSECASQPRASADFRIAVPFSKGLPCTLAPSISPARGTTSALFSHILRSTERTKEEKRAEKEAKREGKNEHPVPKCKKSRLQQREKDLTHRRRKFWGESEESVDRQASYHSGDNTSIIRTFPYYLRALAYSLVAAYGASVPVLMYSA
eukprot:3938292-Rhodomonas_salina.5